MPPQIDDEDVPTLDEFGILGGGGLEGVRHRINRGHPLPSARGKWDFLHTQLWDTLTVLAAGTTELNFFAAPLSSTKTRIDTNLTTAAQIPTGGAFDIMSMRFEIVDDLATPILEANAREIIYQGFCELSISGNRFLERLLSQMPAGGGVFHGGAATTTAATDMQPTVNGVPHSDAAAELFTTIRVPRRVEFGVTVFWPTSPTVAVDQRVRVVLDGILTRRRLPKGV